MANLAHAVILAALASTAVSVNATAQPTSAPRGQGSEVAASGARAPLRGVHEHDGFYLRFGLGFGGVTDGIQAKDRDVDDERAEGHISGIGSVGELMLGGAVARGFVLGGGLWTSTIFVSSYTRSNGAGIPTDLRNPDNLTLVGPFADWYFEPHPIGGAAGGFHAQGGVAFAVLNGVRWEQTRYDDDRRVAVGAGVMAGFGYEWWVEKQWGVGLLARLTVAGLVEEDDREAIWYHGVATFPAFLFTATYN